MPTQVMNAAHVEPVFVESMYLPDKVDIPMMCRAGERVVGSGGIEGAFPDGGLWRIYPMTHVGRAMLLAKGIDVGGRNVVTEPNNPFILRGHDTNQPATRVTIGPLPFSISDEAVIRGLEKEGLKIRGKLAWEMARLNDRTMTGWKTGRRFMSIELPVTPPRKRIQIGPMWVEIYYREMREQTAKCWNCKQVGHRSAQCPLDTVCFECRKPGHKKGDAVCNMGYSEYESSGDAVSDLGGNVRQSDDDLHGSLGTEDESRGGGNVAMRYIDIPQIPRGDPGPRGPPSAVTTASAAEQVPLPPDSDDDITSIKRTITAAQSDSVRESTAKNATASKSAAGVVVPPESLTRKVKAKKPSYAEVVSGVESSSSADDEAEAEAEVLFTKVVRKRVKKSKANRKGKATKSKLRQSDITSFTGMVSNKRTTTETSPDADSKGSMPQKQKL